MMVNTAANVLPAGQVGYLVSPFRSGSTKTECVSFWYHMGGMNPGETPPPHTHTQTEAAVSQYKHSPVSPCCCLCRVLDFIHEVEEWQEAGDVL